MMGMSELLLEEEMSPSQHDSIRKILKSGEILLKMVGDVLDIGKVEAGKLVRVYLCLKAREFLSLTEDAYVS